MTAAPLSLSAGEVEALAAKAARGAGLPWGLAEEAGFAARWLHARGVDGLAVMAAHLTWLDAVGWRSVCAGASPVSGLLLGVALSDDDAVAVEAGVMVRAPCLLLPFLGDIAIGAARPVALGWSGGAVALMPDGGLSGDAAALADAEAAQPVLSWPAPPPTSNPSPLPLTDPETYRILDALALRTTVPATAASRAGAGARTGDND